MWGANHIASTRNRSASPASRRMKSAGPGDMATAAVPSSSRPIQAGDPMNIRIAKSQLIAADRQQARQPQELPVLHVALAPAQIAPDEFDQRRRVLLEARAFFRQHAYLVAGLAHQHRLDLVVAEHVAFDERAVVEHRQLAMRHERRDAARWRCGPNRVRNRPATRRCRWCRSACPAACRTGRCAQRRSLKAFRRPGSAGSRAAARPA